MNWEIAYTNDSNYVRDYSTPEEIRAAGLSVIKAHVPCCFQKELEFSGIEKDLYYSNNIENLKKYAGTNVWYFSEFSAYEFDCLVFEGILGRADVFVNGTKCFELPGGFSGLKVVDTVVDGKNSVVVRIHPSDDPFQTGGLVKNAYVKRKRKCEIKNAYIRTVSVDPEEESAVVRFTAEIDVRHDSAHEFQHLNCKAEIKDEKRVYASGCDIFGSRIDLTVEVPRAKLWWPRNYGRPYLYDASIKVFDGGKQLDEFDVSLGIRTVWLETEITEGGGEISYISVNGKRLGLSGPAWRAVDILGFEDEEHLEKVFESVTDLNCNVLYVAPGEDLLSEYFYDLCDKNGVAVVREISVNNSCNYDDVRAGIRSTACFLRNHPSAIAVCSRAQSVPDVLKNVSPEIPVIPCLDEKGSVFATSGSVPASPSSSTIKRFIPRESVWPVAAQDASGNENAYALHSADPLKGMKFDPSPLTEGVNRFFDRQIDKLNPFCRQTQIVQAEYLKSVIENARASGKSGNGIIWNSLCDGWPCVSDSVTDYYYVRKLAYFYVKRSQSPLVLVFAKSAEDDTFELHAVNDLQYGDEITYVVKDLTESGKIVASGMAEIAPDSNTVIEKVRLAKNGFYLISWTPRTGRSISNHFFVNEGGIEYNSYTDSLKKCGFYDFEGFEE